MLVARPRRRAPWPRALPRRQEPRHRRASVTSATSGALCTAARGWDGRGRGHQQRLRRSGRVDESASGNGCLCRSSLAREPGWRSRQAARRSPQLSRVPPRPRQRRRSAPGPALQPQLLHLQLKTLRAQQTPRARTRTHAFVLDINQNTKRTLTQEALTSPSGNSIETARGRGERSGAQNLPTAEHSRWFLDGAYDSTNAYDSHRQKPDGIRTAVTRQARRRR
jgi:hypothetical protein